MQRKWAVARYGKYECQMDEMTKDEEADFLVYNYRIRNKDTGVRFNYIIEIAKTVLGTSTLTLPYPIPQVIEDGGYDLVKKWLDGEREEKIRATVHSKGTGVVFGIEWKQ